MFLLTSPENEDEEQDAHSGEDHPVFPRPPDRIIEKTRDPSSAASVL
jgi:hypothetical protein